MDASDLYADLDSHHIEGIAVQGDTPFSVPLISHITGNLWTGGCIDGVPLPDDFAHVVSLYPRQKYRLGPDTTHVSIGLHDAGEIPYLPALYSAAGYTLGCLRQGRTLVHCQAGLNRSGLVAGLALVLDGMDPHMAVAMLREKRSPAVLCNETFRDWLLAHKPLPA